MLMFSQCTNNQCYDYYNTTFREKEYKFCIKNKNRINRYYIINGIARNNQTEQFKESGYREVFDKAEINDTLLKHKGNTEVYLIKPDTVLVFPCYCNGKLIE